MATIFLDSRALGVGGNAAPTDPFRPVPEAGTVVRHLVDAGHRVVVTGEPASVDEAGAAISAAIGGAHRLLERVPGSVPKDARGWLVTDDPAACGEARANRRLRTILVGPTVPDRGLAHRPADLEARSLLDAVLTILTAEAMPGT